MDSAVQIAVDHLALTQMGIKTGIEMWGKDGVDAMIREMKQLHDHEVVCPLLPQEITPKVKVTALGYLMFLKKNMVCSKDADVLTVDRIGSIRQKRRPLHQWHASNQYSPRQQWRHTKIEMLLWSTFPAHFCKPNPVMAQ